MKMEQGRQPMPQHSSFTRQDVSAGLAGATGATGSTGVARSICPAGSTSPASPAGKPLLAWGALWLVFTGLAKRVLQRWHPAAPPARLALLERLAIGPRQVLALVEAEGVRVLVATSPEGTPAFFPLTSPVTGPASPAGQAAPAHQTAQGSQSASSRVVPFRTGRVSW